MKSVELRSVLRSLESGARPPGGASENTGEIASLGGEHLNGDGGFLLTNVKRIPRAFFDKMRAGRITPRDILVVKDGATTGKTSMVRDNFPFDEAAVNEHVFRLEVDSFKAVPEYVFHFLRSPRGQKAIHLDYRGATIGGISRDFATKVLLPLPPLPEQRRIADILDRADALRAQRRAALAQLDALPQAIFLEMFGDPVTNPKRWERRPISELAHVVTGNTPSREVPEYFGGSIEWIKSDNLNTPLHYVTRATQTLSEAARSVARITASGAILVTCIAGSPSCIGNAAMTNREVAFNQQINAIIPRSGEVCFFYTQVLVGKAMIQAVSTASMKGMVSKGRLEKVQFISPPFELQRQFALRFRASEALQTACRNSLTQLDSLFASLQHRAFRGEL